jgi:hypothetical protein
VRQDTGLRVALRRGAIGARGGACAKVVQSEVSGRSGLFPVQAGDARSVEVSDVVVGGLGACLAVGLTTYVGACVSVSVGVWEDMCVCVCEKAAEDAVDAAEGGGGGREKKGKHEREKDKRDALPQHSVA